MLAGHHPVPGRVRGHQRGVVDEREERRLQQLDDDQRPLDFDERHAGKDHGTFFDRIEDDVLGRQTAEVVEEGLFDSHGHRLSKVFDV